MGASVRGETGAFHESARDSELEGDLRSIRATAGRAAAGIRQRIPDWKPRRCAEKPPGRGTQGHSRVRWLVTGRTDGLRNPLAAREQAQPRDFVADARYGHIDFLGCRESAEADPQRALREFGIAAERT